MCFSSFMSINIMVHCMLAGNKYVHYISHISHFCHIFQRHIWGDVSSIDHVTMRTMYTTNYVTCYWHVSLNKYRCNFENIDYTALILHGYTDMTLMNICAKNNQLQHLSYMLFQYICQKHICWPKCIHKPYI